jgi:ADP-ribose pyrophosphatase YjhB (NUDIX family)
MRRPATLGVRGVVTDDQGQVLLVRHTYTPGWHLPGGGVERGETCVAALKRELQEEAGIRAEALELVSVHANHAFFPNDHVLVFRVGKWTRGEPLQKGEIAEICFAPPLKPPEGVSAGTKRRLDELFGAVGPSELW